MRNIKLTLEYDGTEFVGWQMQANGPSIQEELERALHQILGENVKTIVAGRTDAGVHARGQVVNFRTASAVDPDSLTRSLNGVLRPEIVVLSSEEVDTQFHARYSAKARLYRYILMTRPTALMRNHSWYVGGYTLDIELMGRCAEMVRGEHDFASFCKSDSDVDHRRCVVSRAEWRFLRPTLEFEIEANRFLYGMVRAMVGTMVEIGRGYRAFDDFEKILAARDRTKAGMAAPAKGLFLERVIY
jgi:tRNA pseudouridine38-40 synthase